MLISKIARMERGWCKRVGRGDLGRAYLYPLSFKT